MGGEIHFESELGVGTTFYITLPFRVDSKPPKAESAKPEQAASIKGAHILLVEDNELNMEISQYILEGAGAIVAQAWNGKEAVRRFSESQRGTFRLHPDGRDDAADGRTGSNADDLRETCSARMRRPSRL